MESMFVLIKIGLYAVVIIGFITVNSLWLIWLERKVSAHIQLRLGPMEVGFHGALQTFADAIKLLGKELITPVKVDRVVFFLAPMAAMFPAAILFLVIPIGDGIVAVDLDIGILFIFAFSAITVLAIFMAGYASHNKYSMLGAVRGVAQSLAYEIPLLLSVLGVIMAAGTLNLSEIVRAQQGLWFIFTQPLAFLIFFIAALAETNRGPFDVPEAESEIIAGFHTEYSGIRFAMFFLGEYTYMFVMAALATILFLGGWYGPFLSGPMWFFLKAYFLIFVMMWVRFTFPRVRVDQLMMFGWKYLIPLALFNILLTGILLKI